MRAGIFDTETTGLIDNFGRPLAKQPHIIEYFCVEADTEKDELGTTLPLLIKPPVKITDEIHRITGINDEMVANCNYFKSHAQEIADFMSQFDLIVAHNAAFDTDMLTIEFMRLGMEIKLPPVICTVEATEWLQGYRLSLGKLHEKLFGVDFSDHHRAGPDTMALGRCFLEMYKRGWV